MPPAIPLVLAAIAASAPALGAAVGSTGALAAGGALGAGAAAGTGLTTSQFLQSAAQNPSAAVSGLTPATAGNVIGSAAGTAKGGLDLAGALSPGNLNIPNLPAVAGRGEQSTGFQLPSAPVGGGLAPSFSASFGGGPSAGPSSGGGGIEDIIQQVIQSIAGGGGDLSQLGAAA